MMQIRMVNCKLHDFDRIYILSQTLAHYFPEPQECVTGIHELLLNALEHGNLGIGFEEKTLLLRQKKWHEEIQRRLALPEHAKKAVAITLMHDARECRLTIADEGKGFAWQHYWGQQQDARRPNGRGLLMVRNSRFDEVRFNPTGNEVTCVAQYPVALRT